MDKTQITKEQTKQMLFDGVQMLIATAQMFENVDERFSELLFNYAKVYTYAIEVELEVELGNIQDKDKSMLINDFSKTVFKNTTNQSCATNQQSGANTPLPLCIPDNLKKEIEDILAQI